MSQSLERPEIAFIARSHDALYEMVDRFGDALRLHKAASHVTNLKDDFKACLNSHIEFENYIMITNNYPLTYAHVEEHGNFVTAIERILEEAVRRGDGEGAVRAVRTAHERHVKYFDEILCRYLIDKYTLEAVVDGLGI